jgi:hypothetical protein
MTDLVEPYTFARPDAEAVVALCDQYLAMADHARSVWHCVQ